MKAAVWLAVVIGAALLWSTCGSGGAPAVESGESVETGTPRSERVAREATIMQQQVAEQVAVQQAESEAAPSAESEQVIEVESSSADGGGADDPELAAAGLIDFGHREGLPFARNVVGDPDAPVVIVEYSDFQ